MEEIKFLEAKGLKSEISQLENILDKIKKKDARVCVSWPESRTEQYYSSASTYNPTVLCVNEIEKFPEDIQNKVIELINNELNELNEKFKNL